MCLVVLVATEFPKCFARMNNLEAQLTYLVGAN
jgi:hypothetical protein